MMCFTPVLLECAVGGSEQGRRHLAQCLLRMLRQPHTQLQVLELPLPSSGGGEQGAASAAGRDAAAAPGAGAGEAAAPGHPPMPRYFVLCDGVGGAMLVQRRG